jgi:hypothetical protein
LKSVWVVFAVLAGIEFLMTFGEKQHKMRKQLNTKYGLKSAPQTPASQMPSLMVFPVLKSSVTFTEKASEYPMVEIPSGENCPGESV